MSNPWGPPVPGTEAGQTNESRITSEFETKSMYALANSDRLDPRFREEATTVFLERRQNHDFLICKQIEPWKVIAKFL